MSKGFFASNRFVLKLMSLAVFSGLSVGIANITINIYAVYLGATASQIGLIGGIRGIGTLVTVLPIGFLIDHFGAKRIYIIGGVIGAVIYSLLSLASSVKMLIIATALSGFFMASRFVSMNSVFLDHLKVIGQEKAGWYRGANSLGLVFIGPVMSAYLIGYLGYHWTFRVASLSLLAAVAIAAIVLEASRKDKERDVFFFQESFGHIAGMFMNKNLLEASLSESLAIAAFSCFNTFIVVVALRIFKMSPGTAALFVSAEGALYILSVFTLDKLFLKAGQRRFYLLGIMLNVLGLLALGCARSAVLLWIGAVLLGVGLGMLNIANVSRLAEIDTKKGKLAGFFTLFTTLGAMLGPIIGGFIGNIFGVQVVFLALIPFFGIFWIKVYSRKFFKSERKR